MLCLVSSITQEIRMLLCTGGQAGCWYTELGVQRSSAVIGRDAILVREQFQFIRKMSALSKPVAADYSVG